MIKIPRIVRLREIIDNTESTVFLFVIPKCLRRLLPLGNLLFQTSKFLDQFLRCF